MRTTILLLTATLISAAPPEINSLHESIKLRFQDRTTFGISRIGFPSPHGRVFISETAAERTILNQLQQNKMELVAYLVGRQALTETKLPTPRNGLQGPVFISRNPNSLPDQQDMLMKGIHALQNKGESYDTKSGDWNVSIRPLRATNETCIQCHAGTSPQMGDTLGVAMYAYRSAQ